MTRSSRAASFLSRSPTRAGIPAIFPVSFRTARCPPPPLVDPSASSPRRLFHPAKSSRPQHRRATLAIRARPRETGENRAHRQFRKIYSTTDIAKRSAPLSLDCAVRISIFFLFSALPVPVSGCRCISVYFGSPFYRIAVAAMFGYMNGTTISTLWRLRENGNGTRNMHRFRINPCSSSFSRFLCWQKDMGNYDSTGVKRTCCLHFYDVFFSDPSKNLWL